MMRDQNLRKNKLKKIETAADRYDKFLKNKDKH